MKKSLTAVAVLSLLGVVATATSAGASAPTSLSGLTASQIIALSVASARTAGSVTRFNSGNVLGVSVKSEFTSTLRSGIGFQSVLGHHVETGFVGAVVSPRSDAAAP